MSMEGQPRVRYEWRGGERAEGVRSRRATAAGQRPGKRRENTSGADLRASEPSGYTSSGTVRCCILSRYACYGCRVVVAVGAGAKLSRVLDTSPLTRRGRLYFARAIPPTRFSILYSLPRGEGCRSRHRGFDPFDRRAERGAGVLAPRERVFVAHGSADSS